MNKYEETEVSSQNSNIDLDERLITAVLDRPPLYNYCLNVKERSKVKKTALWEEVRNTIDSMYINFKIYAGHLYIKNLILITLLKNKIFIAFFRIITNLKVTFY